VKENPSFEDVQKYFTIQRLIEAVDEAEIRCLSVDELISRLDFILDDPCKDIILNQLQGKELLIFQKDKLKQTILSFITKGESIPSKDKPRLDRIIGRLIGLIDDKDKFDLSIRFLHHSRKARRKIGYKTLRKTNLDIDTCHRLLEFYKKNGDEEILEVIARNKEVIHNLDHRFMLENLSDRYWRMRIIEALFLTDYPQALSYSHEFPFEFIHASGRVNHFESFSVLKELFEQNKGNLELVSIYVWVVGKLQNKQEVTRLRLFLQKQLEDHQI
jgi:hypothetical protein